MDHWGCVTSYGIWYDHIPHTYFNDKFIAPQEHNDCVRTIDYTPPDWDTRELGNDDSLL